MIGNKWSGKTKHVISVGGGLSSTIELPLLLAKRYPNDQIDMVICALAGESPDLWRMVDWIESQTSIVVHRIAWTPYNVTNHYGISSKYWINAPSWAWSDIWDAFNHTGRMGNSLADPCSRMLKRETMLRYMQDYYDPAHTVIHVGITADEIDRMLAIRKNWARNGWQIEAPLSNYPNRAASNERSLELLGWVPFVYSWGGSHNNCNGFCVKAGHAQMARLLHYAPDVFYYHARRELEFQQTHGTNATIMRNRVTVNGEVISIPLRLIDFAKRMQSRWINMLPGFDPFDQLTETADCVTCNAL